MARFTHPLDKVKIAAPCKAEWEKMIGTHRVRFCAQCNLNVYNLSEMPRAQAEALITATEGRLCVRFYRRRDGSIITQDCPVGLQALKRRVSYALKAIAAATFTFLSVVGLQGLVGGSLGTPGGPVTGTMVAPAREVELLQGDMDPSPTLGDRVIPNRPRKKSRLAH